ELAFIEQGGYGRSVRTPWLPKSIFQDSLTCINYGYPFRAHPCSDCQLTDFVSSDHRGDKVPCHCIALDKAGTTIEDLENENNQFRTEQKLKVWLRAKIAGLEWQRNAAWFWKNVD